MSCMYTVIVDSDCFSVENVRDPASEVHSSGFNQNGHPLQTEPDLSYFHSIPHIPQLHPTLSATGLYT